MARRYGCGSSATSATSMPSSSPASRRSSDLIASAAARAASGRTAATSGMAGSEPSLEQQLLHAPLQEFLVQRLLPLGLSIVLLFSNGLCRGLLLRPRLARLRAFR